MTERSTGSNSQRIARTALIAITFAMFVGPSLAAEDPAISQPRLTTAVGMFGRLDDVVLPGSELEAVPIEDRESPIVLRIVRTFPHGTDRRYDLEFYGLEPGIYDLSEHLRRKDRSELGSLPSLAVEIVPTLPQGHIEPHALVPSETPRVGGYRYVLVAATLLWIAGIVAYFLLPRKKRIGPLEEKTRPRSLADRLRPLIDRAASGEAGHDELAALERSLLAYWRRRLKLDTTNTADAIARLRVHPEAGALMRSLERWLHQERTPENVDVDALLAPYRNVSERDFESIPASLPAPVRSTPAEA